MMIFPTSAGGPWNLALVWVPLGCSWPWNSDAPLYYKKLDRTVFFLGVYDWVSLLLVAIFADRRGCGFSVIDSKRASV